ncbi:uncharacterized protein SCODWIG_03369 [Saccharomycodes ludwigii]|uniref:Sec39 domain-containing protein n=1 Tax=Saccharomycodes ludwigii TaxID=36035 RepID=A0A376BA86_9ASCO|nr:uncharacterized protein SCODWIG_03369 [Saccharomycodes ludwigii]
MDTDRILLLLSHFVTLGDVESSSKILSSSKNGVVNDCLIKCICVLWPELDDPRKLKFLKSYFDQNHTVQELDYVQYIENNVYIRGILNDSENFRKHVLNLKNFLNTKINGQIKTIEEFIRYRVYIVNEILIDSPLFCEPLWNELGLNKNPWICGVVKPCSHFIKAQRSGPDKNYTIKIKDFEQMKVDIILQRMFEFFMDTSSNKIMVANYQLYPYIKYTKSENLFVSNCLPQIKSFDYKIIEFLTLHSIVDIPSYYTFLLKVIWEHSLNFNYHQITQLLKNIPDETKLENENACSCKVMKQYVEYMRLLDIKSFNQVHDIQLNKNGLQKTYFTVACDNYFQKFTDTSMINPWFFESALFKDLSNKEKELIIIDSLISNKKLNLLSLFIKGNVDPEVLVTHFWKFFYKASSGLPSNANMIECEKIVGLLNQSHIHKRLSTLLDVVETLATKFPTLKIVNDPNFATFKPSHILSLKSNPDGLLEKLLAANPKQYLDPEATKDILKKLYVALDINSPPNNQKLEAFILSLHIETALSQVDFELAYSMSKLLLENENARLYWVVILQVGKFIDADNWPDLETPTEIIYLQMEVLSKLIMIIPSENMESAVSEFSRLQLELVTRDLINDKYSLKNMQKLENNYTKFISGIKSNMHSIMGEL